MTFTYFPAYQSAVDSAPLYKGPLTEFKEPYVTVTGLPNEPVREEVPSDQDEGRLSGKGMGWKGNGREGKGDGE